MFHIFSYRIPMIWMLTLIVSMFQRRKLKIRGLSLWVITSTAPCEPGHTTCAGSQVYHLWAYLVKYSSYSKITLSELCWISVNKTDKNNNIICTWNGVLNKSVFTVRNDKRTNTVFVFCCLDRQNVVCLLTKLVYHFYLNRVDSLCGI